MAVNVVNFYRFLTLSPDAQTALRDALKREGARHGLLGTILLASEGLNGSLAGDPASVDAFLAWLREDPRFAGLTARESRGVAQPFKKLVVKCKRWIIRFAEANDPSVLEIEAAKRTPPDELLRLLRGQLEDVVLVDTRNDYEIAYGTFRGARHLAIENFRDFPEAFEREFGAEKDKTYVFFCTGGIRCEKAVPWATARGFKDVRQLDGGILGYFRDVGGEGWDGTCFVFDDRWAVEPSLEAITDGPPR